MHCHLVEKLPWMQASNWRECASSDLLYFICHSCDLETSKFVSSTWFGIPLGMPRRCITTIICCLCTSLCNSQQQLIEYQTIRIFIFTSISAQSRQMLPNLNSLGTWIEYIHITIELSFVIRHKEIHRHPIMFLLKMFGSSIILIDNQSWAICCSKMNDRIQWLRCRPDITSLCEPNFDWEFVSMDSMQNR